MVREEVRIYYDSLNTPAGRLQKEQQTTAAAVRLDWWRLPCKGRHGNWQRHEHEKGHVGAVRSRLQCCHWDKLECNCRKGLFSGQGWAYRRGTRLHQKSGSWLGCCVVRVFTWVPGGEGQYECGDHRAGWHCSGECLAA